MYVISLVVLVLIAVIAVAWSPIFALIIALPLFVVFLAFVGMKRRADEVVEPPLGPSRTVESEGDKGIWGEPRP